MRIYLFTLEGSPIQRAFQEHFNPFNHLHMLHNHRNICLTDLMLNKNEKA